MKFKFGDRVKLIAGDFDGIIVWVNNTLKEYCVVEDMDASINTNFNWIDEHELELLPQTREEILKNMIEGARYYDATTDVEYFFDYEILRVCFEFGVPSRFCTLSNHEVPFSNLTRIEREEKIKMEIEVTKEQADKIKEMLK